MSSRNLLTTVSHDHECPIEEEEEEIEVAPPVIYDAERLGEEVPQGFDAVRMRIDGSTRSDLSWKDAAATAKAYRDQGLKLFWEIDLGLFSSLESPLGSQTQFLSLCLSLEHFHDTIWKEFRQDSSGLCLYRGSLDLSLKFPWDEEQVENLREWLHEKTDATTLNALNQTQEGKELIKLFCSDAAGEYLTMLAARLPDHLPLYVLFDTGALDDPLLVARLLSKERYPNITVGAKGALWDGIHLLGSEFGWDDMLLSKGVISKQSVPVCDPHQISLAICLPPEKYWQGCAVSSLREKMISLIKEKTPFRVITAGRLLTEWDGLDHLIVDTSTVDKPLFRMLQGFAAAGGKITYVGQCGHDWTN